MLLPNRWGRTIFTEQRDFDGTLREKANVSYDVTLEAVNVEVKETFPVSLFEVSVSPNTKVIDMCVRDRNVQ
jgi:hypothetical protein